jgi:hypothetical protein
MSTNDHNVFGQPITEALSEKNRVFISHRMTDKEVAQEVAQYFEFLGLYYLFDEEDAVLRQVLSEGHSGDRAIVEAIDDGLTHSTHILAVLSERWVLGGYRTRLEVAEAEDAVLHICSYHLLVRR